MNATTTDTDALIYRSTGHAILRCQECKAVGRREFAIVRTIRARLGRPVETQTAEIAGRSFYIRDRYDLDHALSTPCPTCKSSRVTVKRIKGVYVADKTCDARCMGAVGPSCSCSCAGQNHGGGHTAW
ncbi:hypothetical protein [Nocardia asiatica]|uniref:hypothetical protein n=1 Tax=Nocardia asiatica TaxID=209252 RepID=UPI002456DF71|nr:hypothetical protein [Nocardia asiatica]